MRCNIYALKKYCLAGRNLTKFVVLYIKFTCHVLYPKILQMSTLNFTYNFSIEIDTDYTKKAGTVFTVPANVKIILSQESVNDLLFSFCFGQA